MSARNLVRNLRDSGALPTRPAGPHWRSGTIFFTAALSFGAIVYLGVAFGLPGLIEAMEKKPTPVSYARPTQDPS